MYYQVTVYEWVSNMVSYRTPDQTSAEGTSFVRSSINCLWYGTRQQSWEHFPTKILKFGAF